MGDAKSDLIEKIIGKNLFIYLFFVSLNPK